MNDKCIYCQLKELMRNSQDHLVLCSDTVYRLIGIANEPEDLYYILRRLNGSLLLSSCVGGVTDLYYIMGEKTYNELNQLFLLNEHICFEMWDTKDAQLECCCDKESI